MSHSAATRVAALAGLLAVALGAFGAHGLKDALVAHNSAVIWEKAVFYHFIHAVMLYVLARGRPVRMGPWLSFLIGIILFSGSLYLLAATGARWLGYLTPFGGVSFLVGWLWLAVRAGKADSQSKPGATGLRQQD